MLLRERFWLWGHPEGRYNHMFGNEGESRMTPMEACLYLGIRNTFMVPVGIKVDRRKYNKSFTTLKQVGWECYKAGENPELIEPIIEEARNFPNIGCVVFDDFKRENQYGYYTDVPIENLEKVHKRLHENDVRPMDMWMVLYTKEFGINEDEDRAFRKYIEPFDGVIMWTWEEKDKSLIPQKFEKFKKLTEGKRRMLGCYLYNFGESRQASGEAVKWQLDWCRERLLAGEAEGIVLHTNTMADLDYEAYDVAIAWLKEHGDEIVPEGEREDCSDENR